MKTITAYRCLACGGSIEVTAEGDMILGRSTLTTTVDHVEPGDAACRLVRDTLAGEIEALHRNARTYLAAQLRS